MKDGGSVFPVLGNRWSETDYELTERGMTLRDWFAGQILSGLCAGPSIRGSNEEIAKASYTMADAMLAEREAGK